MQRGVARVLITQLTHLFRITRRTSVPFRSTQREQVRFFTRALELGTDI